MQTRTLEQSVMSGKLSNMPADAGFAAERISMNIYALKRDPTGYDEAIGFVVCAFSEGKARMLAASEAGDEGADIWTLDAECKEIGVSNSYASKEEVILRSFKAG